ncbi:MAG: hypothetical protein GXY52_01445 [Chloroflexi bacterium]|nr:hypothetical protein [Chloroflexota bacterium]
MSDRIQVAAYYFPQYHADPRNDRWHGAGWTEWDLVSRAEPRFDGHDQPKVPLWGMGDEADPAEQERKIDAAADHGLDAWIWDWYWYEEGPFLNRALEEGYLRASNRARLPFSLMWANHDWLNIHPAKAFGQAPLLEPGQISMPALQAALDYITEQYFSQDTYWHVDGELYFSIYEVMSLVNTCGGLAATRRVLDAWRERVCGLGLGDIHLNIVVWGMKILQNETKIEDVNQVVDQLGADSVTSYVWIHHQALDSFPTTSYSDIAERSVQDWADFTSCYQVPYFPNVTMGWDSSPRTLPSDRFELRGYPFMALLEGNTPQAFESALRRAREFLEKSGTKPAILTLNAWNEWTEGSYLEPDTRHGMGYLEAIQRVFRGGSK